MEISNFHTKFESLQCCTNYMQILYFALYILKFYIFVHNLQKFYIFIKKCIQIQYVCKKNIQKYCFFLYKISNLDSQQMMITLLMILTKGKHSTKYIEIQFLVQNIQKFNFFCTKCVEILYLCTNYIEILCFCTEYNKILCFCTKYI